MSRRDEGAARPPSAESGAPGVAPGAAPVEAGRTGDTASECRNCGAALRGAFCHACGQEAREPPTRLLPLLHVLAQHATGLEGRAVRTVRTLFILPGALTRAFVDGRRAAFAHPVQVYLWCTALFFLSHAYAPVVRLDPDTGAITSSLSAVAVGTGVSAATRERVRERGLSGAEFVDRFDAVVSASLPALLVGVVGAVALIMALLFRGGSALMHTVFALHWAAFYFALDVLRQLVARAGRPGVVVSMLGSAVALIYMIVALRVVYRRGWPSTIARGVVAWITFALLLVAWLWGTSLLAQRLA